MFADCKSCHDRARDVTEVIVSFSPSDEKRVRPIIVGLQRAGHEVWYDSSADRRIADRIRDTDCVVVVCGTKASMRDKTVLREARVALYEGKFFPVGLDPVLPGPLNRLLEFVTRPFDGIFSQYGADLSKWNGDYNNAQWRDFLNRVTRKIDKVKVRKFADDPGGHPRDPTEIADRLGTAELERQVIEAQQAEPDGATAAETVDDGKKQGKKVFICYRRDDSAGSAGRVRDRLEKEFGADLLFMDVDAIPLGADFVKIIRAEVSKCDVFLAVIGPKWLTVRDKQRKRRVDDENDYVRIEISTALQRDIPVIPLLLDGAMLPKANQLPSDLEKLAVRYALEVRHSSFHPDMDKLVRQLKRE